MKTFTCRLNILCIIFIFYIYYYYIFFIIIPIYYLRRFDENMQQLYELNPIYIYMLSQLKYKKLQINTQ